MNYLPYKVKLIESKIDDNTLHLIYCFKPEIALKYIKCNVIINPKPQEGEWFEYEMSNK